MIRPRREAANAAPRLLLALAGVLGLVPSARADLDAYVCRPDPAFAWEVVGSRSTPAGAIHSIDLTSQVWQGIPWRHDLTVYEPEKLAEGRTALLFISGGSTGKMAGPEEHQMMLALAKMTGARVALLRQVPNQPLLGDKTEDALIAETFVRYLETKDENWPLLFPMAKSAVRAMDAVQAWAKSRGGPGIEGFVVTGASKRGWTTWLTGAVDPRVKGIAPMVIVMLNIGLQGPNQLDVWGKYSEQIEDYVSRGLMERAQTEEGTKLWKLVDPYTFRGRLTMPKLLINGANDRYWTLDALDLYWGGLEGPKALVELPNAGHNLKENREWAIGGLAAFFRHVATGRPMPRVEWSLERPRRAGKPTLTVRADPAPASARLWSASAPTRDFRESRWTSSPLEAGPTISAPLDVPARGQAAYFAELEYEVDGLKYRLTTSFLEPGAPAKKASPSPSPSPSPAAR